MERRGGILTESASEIERREFEKDKEKEGKRKGEHVREKVRKEKKQIGFFSSSFEYLRAFTFFLLKKKEEETVKYLKVHLCTFFISFYKQILSLSIIFFSLTPPYSFSLYKCCILDFLSNRFSATQS